MIRIILHKAKFVTDDSFKIYVDRLRDGQQATISEQLSPKFLDVSEEELTFKEPVSIEGEAYIAGDSLIIHLAISTNCTLPCSICNKPVEVPISIEEFYHAEPMEDIKSGIFNFCDILREAIIIEVPPFTECNDGNCPSRKELKKYLKQEQSADEGYHPFADL
jgi:uncharacterized metal-binding protein YceD (DUF177 family)